jgi:hypothetical protein
MMRLQSQMMPTLSTTRNADLNDAEVNKANVATHAIESALTIDDQPSDVIHDDEFFSNTVQIGKNAGNDEVAESNDANYVKYALLIKENKAYESHASLVATHAIESSIPSEANEANHSNASEDADGKNSHKNLNSNDEIFDDNSTCSDSICGGDSINYYDPISLSGDPQALGEATVLAIDPDDEYPLTLSTCDIVPKGSKVCRITKYQDGKEVKTLFDRWRAIERFKLEKCHIATEAEALIMQRNSLSGIMKDKLESVLDKAQSKGSATEDNLNDKNQPKTKHSKKSRQKRPKTKTIQEKQTKECATPIQKHSVLQ